MTIPDTFSFNNWTWRSLCFELAFLTCVFPVAVPFFFVCPFPFSGVRSCSCFLFCLWVSSVRVVGDDADFFKILFGPDWSSVSLGHKIV